MKPIIAAITSLAALATAAPVFASMERIERALSRPLSPQVDKPAWTAKQIKTPPSQYQGNGAYLFRYETPGRVGELCNNPLAVGCTIGGFVIGPNPCSEQFQGESFAKLLCHEGAHVLGWEPTHPEE